MNFVHLMLILWVHRIIAQSNTTSLVDLECPEFYNVELASVQVAYVGDHLYAIITCVEGYDLDGMPKIRCIEGKWEDVDRPTCVKRCPPPSYIANGALEIVGDKDLQGFYKRNAISTYSCLEGYALVPPESQYRVCEKGFWSGPTGKCMFRYCPRPPDIKNGFYIIENDDTELNPTSKHFYYGLRIHYKCHMGYTLFGYGTFQCLHGGYWTPRQFPKCEARIANDYSNKGSCHYLPSAEHAETTVLEGIHGEPWLHGTIIEVSCVGHYRNMLTPCQPSRLECNDGKWEGTLPKCEIAHDCYAPPSIPYAQIVNFDYFDPDNPSGKFPLKSQITYQCIENYEIQGSEVLKCEEGGCWVPNRMPECLPYYKCNGFGKENILKVDTFNAIIWSAITGGGVIVILLILCCAIITKKQKEPITRNASNSSPSLRAGISDHATLLTNPDRLALIAFADENQNQNEDSLPTYDEAIRRASAHALPVNMLPGCRLNRPHWPSLASRRARNSPNPDLTQVTRHGSFASHSPSTRSGVDSMGSTDTVAISEGSTTITLDTASSHSGSQPGSCRVHCGSLASFDTSSVANTEGAPLLEESELEDLQVNMDSISAADNCSFKSADHNIN